VSTKITTDCINYGVCEAACPNEAISAGENLFVIDAARCTECVGFHDEEQCAVVCPAQCCIPDPGREECEATLFERAKKLHPTRAADLVLMPATSRFRR
jgi:ferredoxin